MDRDKNKFHKEQAEKFRIFADKNPQRERLPVFNEWCESKDFSEEDKEAIFKEAIFLFPKNKQILIPKLNIHLRNDPIALRDIIKFILLAIELGEEKRALKNSE